MPPEANMGLNIQEKDVLEEVIYRQMAWAKMGLIQDLKRVSADPLASIQAQAPFVIQSTPAEPGSDVTARHLEPAFEPSIEFGLNAGKVGNELMRGHESTPSFSVRKIPNYMWRTGVRSDDLIQKKAHENIDYKMIVAKQKAAIWAGAFNLSQLVTLEYGWSPNAMRASATYAPYEHPNRFWGMNFENDFTELATDPAKDLPTADLPGLIAYKCRELNIQPVVIDGKFLNAVVFCDYDLFHAVYQAQAGRMVINDKGNKSFVADYDVEDWARVRFISHNMAPRAPKDVTTLTRTQAGVAGDYYYTLTGESDIAIPMEGLGGPTKYNTLYICGGGSVRNNYGSEIYDENDDPYQQYEMATAGWMGKVCGAARSDRYAASTADPDPTNNSSMILHLRRLQPLAA